MRPPWLAGLVLVASALVPPAPASQAQVDDPFQLRLTAPITTWDEAVPLGNGLTGGLLWGEGNTIRLSLDRADLWDLRTPAIYLEDDWNYATVQKLVAARDQRELVRRFDAPFEEIPYPTKLPGARLEIALEARHQLREFGLDMRRAVGRASFEGGEAEAFFSAAEHVAMIRVRAGAATPRLVAPASLARLGYGPAAVGKDKDGAWLVQQAASGLVYAVHVASRRVGGATLLAVAITSNREAADPLAVARARAASALARGFDALLVPHLAWWRTFWAASSIALPDTATLRQYLEAQYFYGAASRRGAPPMPLQGVWTADGGTLPPWKGDFHFDLNVEMSYWAYLQAGHFDEGAAYLDFMWSLVPAHRRFAERFFHVPGIVVPGVMALDGQPLAGWGQYSLSPVQGAWVAEAFSRHWRYTADAQFLAERAYPYCSLVGEALAALLKPDAGGKLKLPLSTSPEIHDNSLAAWMTPLTNYDLALIRSLFTSLAEMATSLGRSGDAVRWSALLDRLDAPAIDQATGGLKISPDERLTESHRHLSHLMAIHPLGLLTTGGRDEDRRVVTASLDQLSTLGTANWVGYSFAWAACLEARAGRAEESYRYLATFVRAFLLRNGFHANGDQTRSGITRATYRPFTLEGNFAAAQAVHEMLLQSWGGMVRVFPATPAAWRDVAFTNLRAEGGYRVSARRAGGRTTEVRIEAARDGTLRLRDPFLGAETTWTVVPMRGRRATTTAPAIRRQMGRDRIAQFDFPVQAGDVVTGRVRDVSRQ